VITQAEILNAIQARLKILFASSKTALIYLSPTVMPYEGMNDFELQIIDDGTVTLDADGNVLLLQFGVTIGILQRVTKDIAGKHSTALADTAKGITASTLSIVKNLHGQFLDAKLVRPLTLINVSSTRESKPSGMLVTEVRFSGGCNWSLPLV